MKRGLMVVRLEQKLRKFLQLHPRRGTMSCEASKQSVNDLVAWTAKALMQAALMIHDETILQELGGQHVCSTAGHVNHHRQHDTKSVKDSFLA